MSGRPRLLVAKITPERRFVLTLMSGNLEAAIAALDEIVDINYRDNTGLSLMDYALASGSDDIIGALLERGVAISPEQSFIIYLIGGEPIQAITQLESVEDINYRNANGKALIHYAIESGFPQVVRAIAELGADLNVLDAKGLTPLHLVLTYKASEELQGQLLQMIQTLLDKGADPLKKGAEEKSPIDFLMTFTNTHEDKDYIDNVTRIFELYGQQILNREKANAARYRYKYNYPKSMKQKMEGGSKRKKMRTRRGLKKRAHTRK